MIVAYFLGHPVEETKRLYSQSNLWKVALDWSYMFHVAFCLAVYFISIVYLFSDFLSKLWNSHEHSIRLNTQGHTVTWLQRKIGAVLFLDLLFSFFLSCIERTYNYLLVTTWGLLTLSWVSIAPLYLHCVCMLAWHILQYYCPSSAVRRHCYFISQAA